VNKKRLYTIFKLLVSAGFLTFLGFSLDLKSAMVAMKGVNWLWFGIPIVIYAARNWIAGLRIKSLLSSLGYKLRLGNLTGDYFIAFFLTCSFQQQ
jgi:uncharacterized membrane protein YbhN (UPF0104 family)